MRTSHLTLRRRIDSEKLKITDEELFAGGAFSGYLSDMAEAATKRYKRHTAVRCFWDENPDAHAAYTDNRKICINAANPITQSFPTRKLRADSLVGMAGHEIGHILFTDFQMRDLYASSLKAGRMYPAEPSGLTTKEQIYGAPRASGSSRGRHSGEGQGNAAKHDCKREKQLEDRGMAVCPARPNRHFPDCNWGMG